MRKLTHIILCAAAFLTLFACGSKENPTPTKPSTKDLVSPELSIGGMPGAAVQSGTSFTIKLSTKSEGAVSVTVSNPAQASVNDLGEMSYEVFALSVSDTEIQVIAKQAAKGDYAAETQTASFKVKGSGAASLPGPDDAVEGTGVQFSEISGAVVNPERGLYHAHEIHSTEPGMTAGEVSSLRSSGHTLWLLEFYLTDYISSNIPASYVKGIQSCFDAIRNGGAKAIVRFAYRNTEADWNNIDQEPEVDQVLKHVDQLKSVLQKNEDVLFVLQAGFVGTWGEWYYTTHFGMNPKSASDYLPRKKLTDALLASVPVSRQIELRTPTFKMKMYGLSVADAITEATAHDGSDKSRLGGHNDCFGADKNDRGTFDNDDAREFWKKDSRYTIMGGETCAVSDYCLCPQTLQDLEDYHWTYLHDGYHQDVLSRWKSDGCFNEIERRLGYRLVLQDVHYSAIEAGKPCQVTLRLHNKGFAAPMNPREAWLVWAGSDGKTQKTLLGADPRTWHPGYSAVVSTFTPTSDKGTLYLQLSDPLLPDNPLYSIALANDKVFDTKTGLNKLFEVK